jgi:hypothetical protein
MKSVHHLQTMAFTYQEICQGEEPWVALGNFMNDWFDYKKDQRPELVATPLSLPERWTDEQFRWAVFCAASVEYLCDRYGVSCPSWVYNPVYHLLEPWFDAPMAHKPEVREWLMQDTPEPFTRRNIYCGDRMFNNKWEVAEQYASLFARRRSGAFGASAP